MALDSDAPFPFYADKSGAPLQGGSVYFGASGQNPITSPITVYWDQAGTQPATQPISVSNGMTTRNGTPARLWPPADFSRLVLDSKGRQVIYEPIPPSSVRTAFNAFVASLAATTGPSSIGFQGHGANEQAHTLYDMAAANYSIVRWLTTSQLASFQAGSPIAAGNVAIHHAVADIAGFGGGVLHLQGGTFLCDTIVAGTGNEATYIVPQSGVSVVGCGDASIVKVANGQNALASWNVFLSAVLVQGCVFRDFKIDGNAANNLLAAGPSRSNRMLSSSGGGYNITVDNVTFTGCPGNNTLAFSGAGTIGNINVNNCRFLEMGSGIVGNVCVDHTDIYLVGSNCKITNNVFQSTNFITGAPFEFHGDLGEAYGNKVNGYSVSCWIAAVETTTLTHTSIHHNEFINVWIGPAYSCVNGSQFGTVDISYNLMRMKSDAATSGSVIFGIYGPDKPGALVDTLNFINNDVYCFPGVAMVGLQPIQTKYVNITGGVVQAFTDGVRFNASGGAIDGTYDYYDVTVRGVRVKDCTGLPIRTLISRMRRFVATVNSCESATVLANGMLLTATADDGFVGGNFIDQNYTPYPIMAGAGAAGIKFDQVGNSGERWVGYNAASATTFLNKVVYTAGTAAPAGKISAPGDQSYPLAPVVGSPKGWLCTTFGNPGTWVSLGNL